MGCNCNVLGISVLYSAKSEVLSVFIPCFIPEYDAVLHARIIAKRIVLFSCFTQFGACNEAYEPHFSALCTLVTMPGIPFPHIPNHHLGYPILPFGVYFRHICAQCTARFSVCLLRFRSKSLYVFFPFGSSFFFEIHLAG